MNIKEELKKIYIDYHPKTRVKILKSNHKLVTQLKNIYGDLPLIELFYCGFNDTSPSVCQYNKKKAFNTLDLGYRQYCGTGKNCQCRVDSQVVKMQEYQKSINNDTRKIHQEKAKSTSRKNHGVDNPMKSRDIQKKQQQTMLEEYGVRFANQSDELKFRHYKDKTGFDSPLHNPEIQKKSQETNLKRYSSLMTQARESAYIKYNGNPFTNEDVIKKAKNTLLEKYGVDHNSKCKNIADKKQKTLLKRFGVLNPAQIHISSDTFKILEDSSLLENLIKEIGVIQTAKKLNISWNLLSKQLDYHNLKKSHQSLYEEEISCFLTSLEVTYEKNNRKLIKPKEIDFVLPLYNLGIEFCGLYYHTEIAGFKDKMYHFNKYKKMQEQGFTLLTIFEDEWLSNSQFWKNKIKLLLNKANFTRIGARKCIIKNITSKDGNCFLNKHHLQHQTKSTLFLGAFYSNELVSVMAFNNNRNDETELTRFASKANYIIPGIASKLFSYYIKNYNVSKIISFSDNRISNGHLYTTLNFQQSSFVPVDYTYVDKTFKNRLHKFGFSKSNIKKRFNIDVDNKSEWELMQLLGYDRIWDCGKIKWVWST